MFIRMNSTRHTKIGTLRRGVVYDLPDDKQKARDVVAALGKGPRPALKLISEKDVAKLAVKAVALDIPAEAAAVDTLAANDEMAAQFEVMTKALEAAEADLEAERAKVADLETKIAELTAASKK